MAYKKLKLEELVASLKRLKVKKDCRIKDAGCYDKETMSIFYNPHNILSKNDFFVTILHEVAHHLEEDLSEDAVENSAKQNLKKEKIKEFLKIYFADEIKKYWGK